MTSTTAAASMSTAIPTGEDRRAQIGSMVLFVSTRPVTLTTTTATMSMIIPTDSPGIGSSGGGVCSNRYGVTENVGYMNDVAISYGPVSGHEKTIRHVNI